MCAREGIKTEKGRIVVANVIMKSASGKSVVQAGVEITPANVKEFLPKKATIKETGKQLKKLGFKVNLVADTHISISGPRELFEEVFQVRLVEKTAPIFEQGRTTKSRYKGRYRQLYYKTTIPPKIPTKLSRLIETVEFPGPVIYLISSSPPALTYDHLELPDDVARDMDAVKAHRRKITGAGIKMAMVDTGFMTPHHPYYLNKGYNIKPVVADDNDPSPNDDLPGHGTAIAACALAVAPGVTFIPVKAKTPPLEEDLVKVITQGRQQELTDPKWWTPNFTDSFTGAVQQNPNIITCSWEHVEKFAQPLKKIIWPQSGGLQISPISDALQLAINNAVAEGIVVVFACGNGGPVEWPASLQAVISVGGCFMKDDDTVTASDYASSGTNPNNPGRQVPDLCGLVGMAPHGLYIALPTRPHSWFDQSQSCPWSNIYPECGDDKTTQDDGWLVGSGTSSAAPMVAGVAALLMQSDPNLVGNPAAVKDALLKSCIDVTTGKSASGEAAAQGPPQGPPSDLATGKGLVQAYRAVNPTDIWIKDNPSDVGLVPTHNRRPKWPPYSHWDSPDIKVFSTRLKKPSKDFDKTQETLPVFQQNNYVYVRIRNRGTHRSAKDVYVRLYYSHPIPNSVWGPLEKISGMETTEVAKAKTNLKAIPSVAPDADPIPYWNDGQSGMGTIKVNGSPKNWQKIPSVDPDAEVIVPFRWQPPNPTATKQTITLPDGKTAGHFCLLVTLDTKDDPIMLPKGTEASVINDNNIAMKNVLVYPGSAESSFAFAFTLKGAPSKERSTKNDLVFDLSKLPKKSRVILQMEQKHLRKARLVHAEPSKLGIRMTPHRNPAGIYGLTLKPEQKLQMKVLIRFQRSVERRDYPVPIMQMSDGRPVGGATLVARVTK